MTIFKIDTNHHQPFDPFDGECIWEINIKETWDMTWPTLSIVLRRCSMPRQIWVDFAIKKG